MEPLVNLNVNLTDRGGNRTTKLCLRTYLTPRVRLVRKTSKSYTLSVAYYTSTLHSLWRTALDCLTVRRNYRTVSGGSLDPQESGNALLGARLGQHPQESGNALLGARLGQYHLRSTSSVGT